MDRKTRFWISERNIWSSYIKLLDGRLSDTLERCSVIFLVGEFSESPYLFSRVREAFIDRVPIIAAPALQAAAVVRGAIAYGLNVEIVQE
jgi:hypothetical protein